MMILLKILLTFSNLLWAQEEYKLKVSSTPYYGVEVKLNVNYSEVVVSEPAAKDTEFDVSHVINIAGNNLEVCYLHANNAPGLNPNVKNLGVVMLGYSQKGKPKTFFNLLRSVSPFGSEFKPGEKNCRHYAFDLKKDETSGLWVANVVNPEGTAGAENKPKIVGKEEAEALEAAKLLGEIKVKESVGKGESQSLVVDNNGDVGEKAEENAEESADPTQDSDKEPGEREETTDLVADDGVAPPDAQELALTGKETPEELQKKSELAAKAILKLQKSLKGKEGESGGIDQRLPAQEGTLQQGNTPAKEVPPKPQNDLKQNSKLDSKLDLSNGDIKGQRPNKKVKRIFKAQNFTDVEGSQKIANTFLSTPGFLGGFLLFSLLMIVSLWKIFSNAGEKGIKALVPIYNIVVLAKIANQPWWFAILLLVPVIGLFAGYKIMLGLAEANGKGSLFAIGLCLLPFPFFPLLAFTGSKTSRSRAGAALDLDLNMDQTLDPEKTQTISIDANEPVEFKKDDVA